MELGSSKLASQPNAAAAAAALSVRLLARCPRSHAQRRGEQAEGGRRRRQRWNKEKAVRAIDGGGGAAWGRDLDSTVVRVSEITTKMSKWKFYSEFFTL